MKLTDEELSRVLSAHAAGDMRRNGWNQVNQKHVCVLQAAWDVDGMTKRYPQWSPPVANWFDRTYEPTWTADEFLRQLEAQGLA